MPVEVEHVSDPTNSSIAEEGTRALFRLTWFILVMLAGVAQPVFAQETGGEGGPCGDYCICWGENDAGHSMYGPGPVV